MRQVLIKLPTWWKLLAIINVCLIVAAFVSPPLGVVDTSVIAAVGELIIMGLIGLLPYLLNSNKDIKVSKGDASVEISD